MFRLKSCLSHPGHVRAILLAAAALVVVAGPVFASPIVYQHTAPATIISSRASQDQAGNPGIEFQVWDQFTLAGNTLIDAVDWQGSYFNALQANPLLAPPANATGFVVQFYSDSAGLPGALLISQTFTPAGANQTFNSQQVFGGLGMNVHDYTATLSSAFLAAGGTSYWLSVYALSPLATATDAQWGWNGGLGGNGSSIQATAGVPAQVNFDRAFALHGTPAPIPEPATMLLLGSGLVTAAARARRRNRK